MQPNRKDMTKACPPAIAVTGGAGSGKSIVCRRLAELGGCLIDLDQVAREVVRPGSPGLEKVIGRFGPSVAAPDGGLDRAVLRRRILHDNGARKELEAILHPEIDAVMRARMRQARRDGRAAVVEVPLLFEAGMADRFDKVVLVRADADTRIQRLVQRDNVPVNEAAALLKIQMTDDEKSKHSDYIIENNGSREDLLKTVDRLAKVIYSETSVEGEIA